MAKLAAEGSEKPTGCAAVNKSIDHRSLKAKIIRRLVYSSSYFTAAVSWGGPTFRRPPIRENALGDDGNRPAFRPLDLEQGVLTRRSRRCGSPRATQIFPHIQTGMDFWIGPNGEHKDYD